MIYSLKGQIQEIRQKYVILETQGLSWLIHASTYTLDYLQKLYEEGERECCIYTHLQVSDTAFMLYGFTEILEKELFLSLINVSGIAAKGAIKILSSAKYSDIITHIQQKNITLLAAQCKVSQKKAQSIVLKLEDTIQTLTVPPRQEHTGTKHSMRDTLIEGLRDMGYTRLSIDEALEKIIDKEERALSEEHTVEVLKDLIIYLQNK